MKLTRCPHCETLFEVSLNELKTAEGAVRCGQCLRIFNATYHINNQETSCASDSIEQDADDSTSARDQTANANQAKDIERNSVNATMATPSPHNQSIPTITERLNAHSFDDHATAHRSTAEDQHGSDTDVALTSDPPIGTLTKTDHTAISMETTAPVTERINAQLSPTREAATMNSASIKAPLLETPSSSASEETLDFEKLLGLKPAPTSGSDTSSSKQTDDLQALLQLAPEQTISTSEPAASAAITDNHDEEPIDDDYDALAESWSDWVRQQWQWIGAAIILMLAGTIGVLSMTPSPSSSLSNYRIESTQVQTAPIQSRLNIRFELRNLTDQPMSLKAIDIKLKNLTDSLLSEHHLDRSQLQGDLDPIPPFSTRTLEVEVPRPGTLVASVEITPLEND